MKLDEVDKRLLNSIQDIPLVSRPFARLGKTLGIPEDEVITRVRRLVKTGAIRRIGPVISTKNTGGASTLAALRVPEDRIEEVASIVNGYEEVSHNYLRRGTYNIWFTISAKSEARMAEIIRELRDKTRCELIELPTLRLFKIGVRFEVR
ncbi:MAG TPA: Lrp/AsnC family transcriptional regulator [Candidatus Methanoperedenaceae archaeon]|nr:Lrp/AsnC family transcriptional regulator [Candidatus Methanoperedenaceae archaeon]